jgi:hypothetical protein
MPTRLKSIVVLLIWLFTVSTSQATVNYTYEIGMATSDITDSHSWWNLHIVKRGLSYRGAFYRSANKDVVENILSLSDPGDGFHIYLMVLDPVFNTTPATTGDGLVGNKDLDLIAGYHEYSLISSVAGEKNHTF